MKYVCVVTGDDTPESRDTNMCVVPYYAVKWRELGEALGITTFQLDIINVDHPNSCEERCKVMLKKWLKMDPQATWGKLVDAAKAIYSVPCILLSSSGGICIVVIFGVLVYSTFILYN